MNLKEFLSETLVQLVEGVKDAQDRIGDQKASINPLIFTSTETARLGILNASGTTAQAVQFDVALTVTEGTGTKGGIGV